MYVYVRECACVQYVCTGSAYIGVGAHTLTRAHIHAYQHNGKVLMINGRRATNALHAVWMQLEALHGDKLSVNNFVARL